MDIRVLTTFPTHRKIRRLIKTLGFEAVYCLISLWSYTAENHPKGNLIGYDEIDIEEAANWTGKPKKFFDGLMAAKTRFLVKIKGGYALRNWEKHQGWIVNAPARREKARLAASKRWGAQSNATGNATSNAKKSVEQCPSPSPNPSPKPKPIKKDYSVEFDEFWAIYPLKKSKKKARETYFKIMKSDESLHETIIKSLPSYIADVNKRGISFAHAQSWLNAERWNDEYEQPRPANVGESGIPGVEF